MLNVKQDGIKYNFWVFSITRPGIKPRSLGPLTNTILNPHILYVSSQVIYYNFFCLVYFGFDRICFDTLIKDCFSFYFSFTVFFRKRVQAISSDFPIINYYSMGHLVEPTWVDWAICLCLKAPCYYQNTLTILVLFFNRSKSTLSKTDIKIII